MIGSSVEDFINRFKIYRTNNSNDHENILKLNFEKLVLDYETSKELILSFLGEDESIHIYPKKYFDPSVSKKGVGHWKNATGTIKKEISIINAELKEYCIDI